MKKDFTFTATANDSGNAKKLPLSGPYQFGYGVSQGATMVHSILFTDNKTVMIGSYQISGGSQGNAAYLNIIPNDGFTTAPAQDIDSNTAGNNIKYCPQFTGVPDNGDGTRHPCQGQTCSYTDSSHSTECVMP